MYACFSDISPNQLGDFEKASISDSSPTGEGGFSDIPKMKYYT